MTVGKALPFAETQCFNLKNEGLVCFRDLQILSVKDHTVNIFCFVGHAISATAPQLSCKLCLPVSVIPVRSQFKVFPLQSHVRHLTILMLLAKVSGEAKNYD